MSVPKQLVWIYEYINMKINIMQAATPTTGVGEKRTLLYITSV